MDAEKNYHELVEYYQKLTKEKVLDVTSNVVILVAFLFFIIVLCLYFTKTINLLIFSLINVAIFKMLDALIISEDKRLSFDDIYRKMKPYFVYLGENKLRQIQQIMDYKAIGQKKVNAFCSSMYSWLMGVLFIIVERPEITQVSFGIYNIFMIIIAILCFFLSRQAFINLIKLLLIGREYADINVMINLYLLEK